VALIVALGKAAEIAVRDHVQRTQRCRQIKERALRAFLELGGVPTGDQSKVLPSTLNVAIPGLDSESVIIVLRDLIAISNGSACTSQSLTPSHVLTAMGLPSEHVNGAVRLSWCHLTPELDWGEVVRAIRKLQ
jgi:cysteine desulfurase